MNKPEENTSVQTGDQPEKESNGEQADNVNLDQRTKKAEDLPELNSDLDDDDEALGFQILDPLPGDQAEANLKRIHSREGSALKANGARKNSLQHKTSPEIAKTDT